MTLGTQSSTTAVIKARSFLRRRFRRHRNFCRRSRSGKLVMFAVAVSAKPAAIILAAYNAKSSDVFPGAPELFAFKMMFHRKGSKSRMTRSKRKKQSASPGSLLNLCGENELLVVILQSQVSNQFFAAQMAKRVFQLHQLNEQVVFGI